MPSCAYGVCEVMMPNPPIDRDICDVYEHGYGGVRLTWTPSGVEQPVSDHALAALVAVVTTLAPVVQPLALSIRADIYELDFPFMISTDVPFPAPSVLLREPALPPAQAGKLAGWEDAAVTEVPAVSGEAVHAWAAAFLAQWPAPNSSVAVALSAAWCRLARARVFPDQRVVARQLPIRDGATLLGTLPLETRADGVWVAGPVESQVWRAPVWYEFANEGWQCEVNIQAGWSFWGMPQYPECQALVAAIHRLIGQDWQLAAASHFFEELFPRPE